MVALTETLYHDLKLAQAGAGGEVGCSLLCPAFVPTGIADAERARPEELRNAGRPTRSQIAAGKQLQRAVQSGKLTADDVADIAFEAIAARRFYIITHPGIMRSHSVSHALCVSVDLETLPSVLDIASRYDNVYASVGVHPDHEHMRCCFRSTGRSRSVW